MSVVEELGDMLRTMLTAVTGGLAGIFALLLFEPSRLIIEWPILSLTEQITLVIAVVAGIAAFFLTSSS